MHGVWLNLTKAGSRHTVDGASPSQSVFYYASELRMGAGWLSNWYAGGHGPSSAFSLSQVLHVFGVARAGILD